MFNQGVTLEQLNHISKNTLVTHLGIEITEIGADFIKGKMPVDARTHQPFGVLHGGASVALAETLGSVASFCCIDNTRQYAVGLDINANHIRPVAKGYVYGTATPLHIGQRTHVWQIEIVNEAGKLVCMSRLTMMINDKNE